MEHVCLPEYLPDVINMASDPIKEAVRGKEELSKLFAG